MNKNWISENNIDRETVTLHRYSEGEWDALETVPIEDTRLEGSFLTGFLTAFTVLFTGFASADDSYYLYRAKTPGFSYFAITGNETVQAGGNGLVPGDDIIPGLFCLPGSMRCLDNELQECNPTGTVWVSKEVCIYGCYSITMKCNLTPPDNNDESWYPVVAMLVLSVILILAYLAYKKSQKTETMEEALRGIQPL